MTPTPTELLPIEAMLDKVQEALSYAERIAINVPGDYAELANIMESLALPPALREQMEAMQAVTCPLTKKEIHEVKCTVGAMKLQVGHWADWWIKYVDWAMKLLPKEPLA